MSKAQGTYRGTNNLKVTQCTMIGICIVWLTTTIYFYDTSCEQMLVD